MSSNFVSLTPHYDGSLIENAKNSRYSNQLESASQQLEDATKKLANSIEINSKIESEISIVREQGEWTKSYEMWSKWEDLDNLVEKKKNVEQRLESLLSKGDSMGHYHDHSEENKIFHKSENEKRKICEFHREKGNFLFQEGLLPKAAEQYQIALSYYEYCFPEDENSEKELNELRHACLCNISLCYYKLEFHRKAVESATLVINENPVHVKALYRRAQAYRALDEYGPAERDIRRACDLAGDGVCARGVVREMALLAETQKRSLRLEQAAARLMLEQQQIGRGAEQQPADVRCGRREQGAAAGATDRGRYVALDCSLPLEPADPSV